MVRCLECGSDFKKVTNTHLKRCCGLTEAQYLAKHVGAVLMDDELKHRYGSPGDKNPKWKGGVSKPNCARCGTKISEHSRVTHCNRCRSIVDNPFQGKQHSPESRKHMVESARSRPKETYKQGIPDPAALSRRRTEAWAKIPPQDRAGTIQAFIAAGQRNNKKNRGTRIEVAVASILGDLGYEFRQNVQVGTKNVDFLVGDNLVIECYGDYWHCNPILYAGDYFHVNLHMTAADKHEKDASRNKWLEGQGMRILVCWEKDIKTDTVGTSRIVSDFLKRGYK